jgi:hypothetical protein
LLNNSLCFLQVEKLDDNGDDKAVDPGVVSNVTNPTNSSKKLAGMGTDAAASNIAVLGLKGLV